MDLTFDKVPEGAYKTLIHNLKGFGVVFEFDTAAHHAGTATSISGKIRFKYDIELKKLDVVVIDNPHFSKQLLIGGMKQMVSEALESYAI